MGNHFISFKQILDACEWADLKDFISNLNEGLQTKIAPAAANLPSNIAKKILLARAYLSKPKLLLLDDFFHQVQRKDKLKIIDALFNQNEIAVLMITSQKEMLEKSDYIYIMQSGTIVEQGTYAALNERNALHFFTNQ
jgi:ABC-type multidrug transport system fused ATPase/permease subunit